MNNNDFINNVTKSLNNIQFEYDEKSWSKLSQKLDNNKRKRVLLFSLINISSLIIILIGLQYIITNYEKANIPKISKNANLNLESNIIDNQIISTPNMKRTESKIESKAIAISSLENDTISSQEEDQRLERSIIDINQSIPIQSPISKIETTKLASNYIQGCVDNSHNLIASNIINTEKISFNLGISSSVNFDDAIDNINYGLGIGVDIPITDGLLLNTGFLASKQQFSSTINNSNESSPTRGNDPTAQADYTTLDFQFGLKYRVASTNNTDYFINAGISSLMNLSSEYSATIDLRNSSLSENDEKFLSAYHQNSEELYFARQINIGGGIKFKQFFNGGMLLEPFIKIPIGTFNNLDAKFYSGGMNIFIIF